MQKKTNSKSLLDQLIEALRSRPADNTAVLQKLDTLIRKVDAMTAEFENLSTEVTEATTVMEGASTLLDTLADEIRSLKDDPAALEQLAQRLDASQTSLGEAIARNTAAQDEVDGELEPTPA